MGKQPLAVECPLQTNQDRLWDVLGKGEEYAIADYAAAHWKIHQRPLRIAVDEACWRFNNLSDEQVVRIREGEPAANPIEKTILWRILRFWRLNIQVIFITDGLKKPGKKRWNKPSGRGGGKVDKECIKMLHRMFDRLHVPYHEAPGEAEAECARMQQLGVVDAVWSDDGDCLMFGCTTLIKAHGNAAGEKKWDRIQVYQAEKVLPPLDFDADSLVMFAVVAGGDYDEKGLVGCGTQKAKILVQRNVGLAKMLRQCENGEDFTAWRHQLATTCRDLNFYISVPGDFPYLKALNGYRRPAVSEDEQCRNIRRLHAHDGGWDWWESQMDQTKLRVVLRDHYNFQTRDFLKHLGPVFLARALTRNVTPARREENLSYGVILRRTQNRKGKNGEDLGQPSEVNIRFDAAKLVQINLAVQPPEEDWSCTVKGDNIPYDAMKPIDGVMLGCFLANGLPEGALDKAPTTPKKSRKSKGADTPAGARPANLTPVESRHEASPTSAWKARSTSQPDPNDIGRVRSEPEMSQTNTSKKRKLSAGDTSVYSKPAKKSRESKKVERMPSLSPPRATFKRLTLPNLAAKKNAPSSKVAIPPQGLVIDLNDDSASDDDLIGHSTGPSSTLLRHNRCKAPRSSDPRIPKSSPSARNPSQQPTKTTASFSSPPGGPDHVAFTPQASAIHFEAYGQMPLQLPPHSKGCPASLLGQIDVPSTPALQEIDSDATPSVAMLRWQRERGLLSKLTAPVEHPVVNKVAPTPPAPPPAPLLKPQYEVIDLT